MTTTTARPPSWRPVVLVCLLAAVAATYFLVTSDAGILDWPGIVVGAGFMFTVVSLLRGWPFLIVAAGSIVAVHVWGSESFQESWTFGLALTLLVIAVLTLLAVALNESARNRPAKTAPSTGRRIVGLAGYAGSGKDTAARGLFWGAEPYTRVSFADKLREFVYAQNPLVEVTSNSPLHGNLIALTVSDGRKFVRVRDLVDAFGWDRAKNEVDDVRQLLQRTGTDAGREVIGENVWVDAVMSDLPEGNVVFTDCRFPNEAAGIKAAGGMVARVSRPGVMPVNGHKSEYAMDDWPFDAFLYNNDSEHAAGKELRNLVARWHENT